MRGLWVDVDRMLLGLGIEADWSAYTLQCQYQHARMHLSLVNINPVKELSLGIPKEPCQCQRHNQVTQTSAHLHLEDSGRGKSVQRRM